MKKFSKVDLPNLGHMTAICLLAATVSACGGTSGGSAGGDDDDLFGGVDPTLDTDNDGVTDAEEAILGTDPTVFDTDNDGDGISNFDEIANGTDPTVFDVTPENTPDTPDNETPAGSDCDTNSNTSEWGDNCTVRNGGTFATSSYAKGIQRILWCQGFDNDQDINSFADGIFGPNSEAAMRDFQTANDIVSDGEVGMETWPVLFEKLSILSFDDANFDVHSIDGDNCSALDAQFYQMVEDGALAGWKMAEFPGSTIQVDFGTGAP